METELHTVRIAHVSPSSAMQAIMRAGQMESAKKRNGEREDQSGHRIADLMLQ